MPDKQRFFAPQPTQPPPGDLEVLRAWLDRLREHLKGTPSRYSRGVFLPDKPADAALLRASGPLPQPVHIVRGTVTELDRLSDRYLDDDRNHEEVAAAIDQLAARVETLLPMLGQMDGGQAVLHDHYAPEDEAVGPIPPDGFRWDGTHYTGLSPIPWRLVDTLWGARNRTCEIRTLGGPVWGDHAVDPDENAVGSARKSANAFFRKHDIPLLVSKKGDYVFIKKRQ